MDKYNLEKIINKKKIVKLDVGCGPNKQSGYIGIDIADLEGVDCIVDLEKNNLPIKDSIVDEIYCSHFLEHVSNPSKVLDEFSRVLKHNGLLKIKVPHYTNPYSYHFTHKTFWSSYSFEQQYLDYYTNCQLVLESKKIIIKTFRFIDPLFNFLANISPAFYERFSSSFLKAWELEFVLKKDENKKEKITIK